MTQLVWTAGKDGTAHAARPGHVRTLCDLRPQDPRWGWPERTRCADCLAVELWPVVRRVSTTSSASVFGPDAAGTSGGTGGGLKALPVPATSDAHE